MPLEINNNIAGKSKRGRSCVNFEHSSERTKRRKSQDIRIKYTADELAHAAQMKVREQGNIDAANICKEACLNKPTRSTKMNNKINSNIETFFEPHEDLCHMINTNSIKSSYNYIRKVTRVKNCYVWPS